MSKCDLRNICNEVSLRMRLTSVRNDGDTRVDYYGDQEAEDYYSIGLCNGHYFIHDRTNLTSFSLEHYNDIMFMY